MLRRFGLQCTGSVSLFSYPHACALMPLDQTGSNQMRCIALQCSGNQGRLRRPTHGWSPQRPNERTRRVAWCWRSRAGWWSILAEVSTSPLHQPCSSCDVCTRALLLWCSVWIGASKLTCAGVGATRLLLGPFQRLLCPASPRRGRVLLARYTRQPARAPVWGQGGQGSSCAWIEWMGAGGDGVACAEGQGGAVS